jgi:uncharacterized protein with NRDE domain
MPGWSDSERSMEAGTKASDGPVGMVISVCLLVVASRVVPEEPLIVGANRDEFLDRPATAVTVLEEGPIRIVGGRDERSGGTWLAVNEVGLCAGLTNQPLGDRKDPSKRSRGELPLALARHGSAAEAVEAFVHQYRPDQFNGAWLLVGDPTSLYLIDFTTSSAAVATELPPGIHVLENRALGESSSKVNLVREVLGAPTTAGAVVEAFHRVLVDHRLPEGEERPQAANCVHLETFGTRSSCIIRVPAGNGPPRLSVADGAPCATAYADVTGLWSQDVDAAGGQAALHAQSRTSGL